MGLLKKKEKKPKMERIMKRQERIFFDLNCRLMLKRTKATIVRTMREEVKMSMAKMLLQMMNEARKGWKWRSLLSRLMKDSSF